MGYQRSVITFSVICLLLIGGCAPVEPPASLPATKTTIFKPTQNIPADTRYNGHVNIRGEITRQISSNEFLVEGKKEADTQFEKARVKITAYSLILDQGAGCSFDYAKASDLEQGQRVEVTFNSPILPTDPVQAEASQVVLLDHLPRGSTMAGSTPAANQSAPDIRGVIKKLTYQNGRVAGILVDGSQDKPNPVTGSTAGEKTAYDKAYINLYHCTRIFERSGDQYTPVSDQQLKEGQSIDALFFGRVSASDPVQAQGMEMIIHIEAQPKIYLPVIHK